MYRKIEEDLKAWKNDFKMPLMLVEAKQTGKTYILENFSKNNFDKYEIDFLVKIDGDIIPVEVKSGRRTNSKSLNEYIKKYNPKYSIRISLKNFDFENNIKSVPLYAVFCINN